MSPTQQQQNEQHPQNEPRPMHPSGPVNPDTPSVQDLVSPKLTGDPPPDFKLAKPGSRDYVAGQPVDDAELADTVKENKARIQAGQAAAAKHTPEKTHAAWEEQYGKAPGAAGASQQGGGGAHDANPSQPEQSQKRK